MDVCYIILHTFLLELFYNKIIFLTKYIQHNIKTQALRMLALGNNKSTVMSALSLFLLANLAPQLLLHQVIWLTALGSEHFDNDDKRQLSLLIRLPNINLCLQCACFQCLHNNRKNENILLSVGLSHPKCHRTLVISPQDQPKSLLRITVSLRLNSLSLSFRSSNPSNVLPFLQTH